MTIRLTGKKIIYSSLIAAILPLASCRVEEEPKAYSQPVELQIRMKLAGADAPTRASMREDDGWTYRHFSSGDKIGFYSSSGRFPYNSPFVNLQLEYSHTDEKTNFTIFKTEDGQTFDPAGMIAKNVFLYSPYSENMSAAVNPGINLRETVTDGNTNVTSVRCIDFLTGEGFNASNLDEGILSGVFYHIFSELIIIRGEGFDKPKAPTGDNPNRITVVMKEPFTHVKVNYAQNPWSCRPELIYYSDVMSADAAKRWETWKHGLYYDNEFTTPVEADYVVLPTLGNTDKETGIPVSYGQQTEVDYIELYDNDGVLQRVTSLSLADGNSRRLNSGWRFPMTISMKELVPTVYPHTIQPWGPDKDITELRTKGIKNSNFYDFVNDYNSYQSDPSFERSKLYNYGDFETMEGSDTEGKWHFYLQEDIDLSIGSFPQGGNPIIRTFSDVLDGKKSTLSDSRGNNYRIFNQKSPLIGTMMSSAIVEEIDFDSPLVACQSAGDAYDYIGVIANNITTGAAVVNCTITNGTVIGPNYVGLIAGSVIDGNLQTPQGCKVQGTVIGKQSDSKSGYMFGYYTGATFSVTNDANIIFNRTQEY